MRIKELPDTAEYFEEDDIVYGWVPGVGWYMGDISGWAGDFDDWGEPDDESPRGVRLSKSEALERIETRFRIWDERMASLERNPLTWIKSIVSKWRTRSSSFPEK